MYLLANIFVMVDTLICKVLEKRINAEKIFLITAGIFLVFISGFRGGFTPDYINYESIFLYVSQLSFRDIFTHDIFVERGYAIINKIVSLFTDNYSILLLIISSIMIYILFNSIRHYSKNVYFSVLLLINFGSYYTSFNTLRQYFVSILFLISMKYIFEREIIKYIVSILLFATIHKSILIMLPMYFILPIDFRKKKNLIPVFLLFAIYIMVFIYQRQITDFVSRTFYEGYARQGAFGIETGTPIFVLFRPAFVLFVVIFLFKFINFQSIQERVWLNSTILFLLMSILSLKIEMFQRMTYFFIPAMLFLIPNLVSRINSIKERMLVITLLSLVVIGYGVYTTQNVEYYFVWEK